MKPNIIQALNIIEAALTGPYVFLNRQQTIDTASALQALKEVIESQLKSEVEQEAAKTPVKSK